MTEPEHFLADVVGLGDEIDIMPLVREAINACPYRHDLLPVELAEIVRNHAFGKYIPVDVQDRVEGRNIGALIGFVVSRVRTTYRIEQLREPAPIKAWEKYIELDPWLDVCPTASDLTGRFLRPGELKPLPLAGCWGYRCQCSYRALTLRDLGKEHRLDSSGNPIPMPKKAVSCYVEDHPEEFQKASPLYRARTPRELGTRK